MARARTSLLLDVDTGIDDSLALLYACASPEAEVVAVTCVGGNVDARQVAQNSLAVLELAGRGDVEVALGRERPLMREPRTTPETHGPRGLGYAELPPPEAALSRRHAVDLIVEEARRRPDELTLVALGPLTNVALAVLRDPELPRLLRRLVIMGGSYRSPGNTAPTTEWNTSVDPEAASIVFRAFGEDGSASRPLALGLDATQRVRFLPEHLSRLEDLAGARGPASASMGFLADALRFYFEFHARFDGFHGAFLHDPVALAVALDPGLARAEPVAVQVELSGDLTAGETVADWRGTWGHPPNVDVAVEVDGASFLERFVRRLARLAARQTDEALN